MIQALAAGALLPELLGRTKNVWGQAGSTGRALALTIGLNAVDPSLMAYHPINVAIRKAELVKKLNEHIADKDFLTKSGIDLAAFNAAARKAHAKNKDLVAAIDEIEKLHKREAPKADSAEAKGRSQVTNRHVLEMLYGGLLLNQQPVKRSGVVYRSAGLGETLGEVIGAAGEAPEAPPLAGQAVVRVEPQAGHALGSGGGRHRAERGASRDPDTDEGDALAGRIRNCGSLALQGTGDQAQRDGPAPGLGPPD